MTTANTTARFIVITASAPKVGKFGNYRRVAVVETDGTTTPKMISERAKGVVKIVKLWDRVNYGGPKSAYAVALAEAEAMAAELNAAK